MPVGGVTLWKERVRRPAFERSLCLMAGKVLKSSVLAQGQRDENDRGDADDGVFDFCWAHSVLHY